MSNGKGDKLRCGVCGRRRRGSNHSNGSHHQKGVEARKKAAEALKALQAG